MHVDEDVGYINSRSGAGFTKRLQLTNPYFMTSAGNK